ncbi:MAG TPA: cyclic nucleotide-binding domain-containing protein [Methyloprofundus sp.]|uniref:cyclic nucleotide-binding domain-containing protein n=1 Tax=Methyloprofundus sp. TaxID=2020875 RepID=UPI001809D9D0|nr:cyclic nucleotide-binding domain-containing protein [Methyloprofundus sp.]HIG66130.1 cyclic nucleotide-binding domain-containing protein [Methyloprofundus sp.]HIL77575.1 cyclic nucleotide-binding domain-containing protein [Methylococcales bacterium]
MAVNPKSEQGQALRKLFPMATMPAQQFKELCADCDISNMPKGNFLFNRGDQTDAFFYLIEGTVSLEANEFLLDAIKAGTDVAKFSLAHQFPRKVSARALDNVRFISLGLNVFDKTDIDYNEMKNAYLVENDDSEADASIDWLAALLQSPVFQRLPAVNLQKVLMSLEEVKFAKGEIILRQEDEGDYCYLIKKGSCSLSRKASSRAKEIKYLELSAGDIFGEHAILADERRSMTVTADTDMLASRIDAERFIKLIKEPAVKYIDYNDLKHEREQNPELVVLDMRSTEEYKKSHIDGSRNIPFFTLRKSIHELMQEPGKIVVICADGRTSAAVAFELIKHNMNAVVLNRGMQSIPDEAVKVMDENQPAQDVEEIAGPLVVEDVDSKDIESSLQQENQLLKANNERLATELNLFKKQYKLLYTQTEKLKAALDKLRAAK